VFFACQGRLVEAGEDVVLNIARHRHVAGSRGVISVQDEAHLVAASPVGGTLVFFLKNFE
jgi:hypothetical protein